MSKETVLSVLKEIKSILHARLPVAAVATKSDYLRFKFSPDRFKVLPDGWIKDNLLGIDWSPKSLEKKLSWDDAQEDAAKLGRQPEIDELDSLTNRSKNTPAIIESAKVLDLYSDYYWSATEANATYAYLVYFSTGDLYNYSKTGTCYVRAVRSGQ